MGMNSPLKYFAELQDPRVERTREHLLEEILLMTIAAVLSGAGSWNEIEDYGKAKRAWFQSFLQLPGGIPSHDTFNRVIAALDPVELEKGFVAWVNSIARLMAGEVVAIDGKALCGTLERGKKTLVHMVSAWASANNLVLAQRKVDDKSNEITAIPKLLAALELSGTVVTIDAMGCQRTIARQIVDRKADYIWRSKRIKDTYWKRSRTRFKCLPPTRSAKRSIAVTARRAACLRVIADLSLVENSSEWASLQGLVRIQAERYHKATGQTERETRYYITSLQPDAARLNRAIRQHWGIENKLHWRWMSALARTSTANVLATPRRTSPCSTASPSTCSNRTNPASSASMANASKPVGTMTTCSDYSYLLGFAKSSRLRDN